MGTKIPTILQGDTATAIAITLAANYDFTGATLEATYQGIVKTFTGITAGGSVSLVYSSKETASFAVKTDFVRFRLLKGETVYTMPLSVKVKVTDCPADVYTGTVSIAPATLPANADTGDSLGALKTKFNALLTAVRNAGLACLSLALGAQGASVTYGVLNDISGTNTVVRSVSFSGLATAGDVTQAEARANAYTDTALSQAGALTPQTATNIAGRVTSNIVTKAYVENLGIEAGTDTATVLALIETETGGTNGLKTAVAKTSQIVNDGGDWSFSGRAYTADFASRAGSLEPDGSSVGFSMLHFSNGRWSFKASDAAPDEPLAYVSEVSTKADRTSLNAISNTVALWQGYWGGDDFRVTITNYDSQTHMPSLFMEDKLTEGGTNFFRKVWDERTRWDAFLGPLDLASWGGFYHWSTNVTAELDQKADRAWGFYDSHTGEYAPEGYTQISSSNILISSGMAYQRTLTAQGAVWVLTANGSAVQTGGMTNGFFRISDDEGNSMFEIVKGSKREVGADASSTSISEVGGLTYMTVVYPVVSDTHPTMYFASSLGGSATWYAETDALCPVTTVWSGSSGNWSVTFHYNSVLVAQPRLFAKAGYMVGGETQIRQSVPVDMQYIILNGQKYSLGTASISGNTVLTLSPVN